MQLSSLISVVVLTHNSEKLLDEVLRSVESFAAEIILVDDDSTDQTLLIAARYHAKIFSRSMNGFGAQKQFAIDQAANDWIFLIDSDEVAPIELAREIAESVKNSAHAAYRLPRRNYYFGRWLKYGGKYPDFQTRLFKKSVCRFSSDIVHEKVMVSGSTGELRSFLNHFSYPDIETWTHKLNTFAEHRGQELFNKGLRPGAKEALRYCFWRPLSRFIRRYIFKLGFCDGAAGFLACAHDALTEILGYVHLASPPFLKGGEPKVRGGYRRTPK